MYHREIKNEIEQYFCSFRIISLDPVSPRRLSPLVEEPDDAFDSQKILEDISSINLVNIIKNESDMAS